MKKVIIFSIIILTLNGCKDFLDREPIAKVNSSGFYNTEANTMAAANAIYDVFTWERYGHILFAQGDCASDDAEVGGDVSKSDDQSAAQDIMLYKAISGNLYVVNFAKLCYTGIQRCNTLLKETDPETNDLSYNPSKYRGEASFLRAVFYYYLVNTMGPVPLVTEPVTDEMFTTGNRAEGDDAKGTKQMEAIYNQIVTDLEYAAANLPTYSQENTGRATKASAYGYLIKAYATMASSKYIFADKKDYWQKVITYSDKIRSEDPRKLESDYHKLFTIQGENCSESLFEIQFITSSNYGPKGEGSEHSIDFSPRGVFELAEGYGYGLNSPTVDLVKQFDINTGTSIINWKDEWVLTPNIPLDSSTGANKTAYLKNYMKKAPNLMKDYVDYDPRLDLIAKPGDSLYNIDKKMWFHVKAFKGDVDQYFSVTGFWGMKTCSALVDNADQANQLNKKLLRYADVLLIEAEARFHTGDVEGAKNLVNQVRKRARESRYEKDTLNKSGYNIGYKIVPGRTPKDLTDISLSDIQNERRRELFLEGIRFYDLVRWDLANTICSNRPPEFHGRSRAWKNDQSIFVPIPYRLINDGKGNVIQNPGY